MDPLSITASAVALAASVLRSAAYLKNAADEYRNGPSVVCDIEGEVKIVQAALLQVEAALQRDAQSICRLRRQHVFKLSVEGCMDTLQQIDSEFETLFGRRDWKVKLAVWWNAGEIRRLLATLDTKKGSLTLLVQALSLHSVQELQDLLQQNMRTLDAARLGLDDMVHSYPAYASKELDTVASAIGSEDSVLGDRDSVVSSTRFAFDDICFTSKPYRQTVARVLAKKASKKKSRKVVVPVLVPPNLATVKEVEAETTSESRDGTANSGLSTGVSAEEHEAVVAKLREAEALIQQLQERMRQSAPFTAKETELPTSLPAAEMIPLAEDAGEERPDPAAKSDEKRPGIPKVSYAIPDAEASTTIITGNTKVSRRSQTSLLIEYFERGKQPEGAENSGARKPSVRVRVTPRGIKHMQNGPHTSPPIARRKRRIPRGERRNPAPIEDEDEDEPLHDPAAAKTVSKSDISSIPPCSFLDGPEPPSAVHQCRDPAEPPGSRPFPGDLREDAEKLVSVTARELEEKTLREERPSRAIKVRREKEGRSGKERHKEREQREEEDCERRGQRENQRLETERRERRKRLDSRWTENERREFRERLNKMSLKGRPLTAVPSPEADDDPSLRPSTEKIWNEENTRALEQVDELIRVPDSTPGTDDRSPQDASRPRPRPKKSKRIVTD